LSLYFLLNFFLILCLGNNNNNNNDDDNNNYYYYYYYYNKSLNVINNAHCNTGAICRLHYEQQSCHRTLSSYVH